MAVNIPPHLIETINKMVRVSSQLRLELGREPTPEDIAQKLAMPVENMQKLLEIANRSIVLTPS